MAYYGAVAAAAESKTKNIKTSFRQMGIGKKKPKAKAGDNNELAPPYHTIRAVVAKRQRLKWASRNLALKP